MNIRVTAGANLQAALDSALPGDVVELEAGATFTGMFELPEKSGRVTLQGKATLIGSQPSQPTLRTRPRANFWWIEDITAQGAGTATVSADVVRLGSNIQTIHDVPRLLTLQRVKVVGGVGQQRGITLNSADTTIRQSSVKNIKAIGRESQAICGWNTPGGILVEDCELEAGSIGFMIGGTPPSIPGLTPTGIEFRRNHVSRPVEWRTQPYVCKNLFELKHARHAVVEYNTFENNWFQAQFGYAIVFTPRSGAATAPWTTVSDVVFRRNLVQHCGAGINTLGSDTNFASGPLEDVVIEDNIFLDIDGTNWGGSGNFLQLVNEPHGLTVVRNVVLNSGHAIFIDSSGSVREPVEDLYFKDNILRSGTIRGNGTITANTTIATYLPNAYIVGNELGGENPLSAPAGNTYPARTEIDTRYGLP